MLEILFILLLCKGNTAKARSRGRSDGWAIGYTILLWVGMEFLGAIIGAAIHLPQIEMYVMALLFAGLGGLISWLIAKRDDPIEQNEVVKLPNSTVVQEVEQTDDTTV